MQNTPARKDAVSLLIKAAPAVIYQAFLDPEKVAVWRPPAGMSCKVFSFDAREGGGYKMSFRYNEAQQATGKTNAAEDIFKGRFMKLVPGQQIVEEVDFESEDPAFAGTMTITTTLTPAPGGTLVLFEATNVPAGISPQDHYEGMMSSLKNLATFTE